MMIDDYGKLAENQMDELSKIRGARFSSLVENERAGADLVTEILYHHRPKRWKNIMKCSNISIQDTSSSPLEKTLQNVQTL